ncbi:MAG TPA: antibiotic biosynthesis monooxygenase family protein [Ktedonobacterales bacterium]|nr:antibiotic biosynthesis monooxygenase family protein [Ktedonobacterales bacterium]
MITEIAVFQAVPGKEEVFARGIQQGIKVIGRDPGCRSVAVQRCIEDPARFLLIVQWESLEAHIEGFRKSPSFAEYRSHINGLFLDSPAVHHYEALDA